MGNECGEKGACLKCEYFRPDAYRGYCMQKNMRDLCYVPMSDEDREFFDRHHTREVKTYLHNKYKLEVMKAMEKKVNPSWCHLRKEN